MDYEFINVIMEETPHLRYAKLGSCSAHRFGQAGPGWCYLSPGGTDRSWSSHRYCWAPDLVFLSDQMEEQPDPFEVSDTVFIVNADWVSYTAPWQNYSQVRY